jgi:hypothetical protein
VKKQDGHTYHRNPDSNAAILNKKEVLLKIFVVVSENHYTAFEFFKE